MATIISIAISLGLIFVLYYIFENFGKYPGIIVTVLFQCISVIIRTDGVSVLTLTIGIILSYILGSLAWKAFQKSESFWSFFGWLILYEFLFGIIVAAIMAFILNTTLF